MIYGMLRIGCQASYPRLNQFRQNVTMHDLLNPNISCLLHEHHPILNAPESSLQSAFRTVLQQQAVIFVVVSHQYFF
jgi:hypothetical protein